MSSPAAEDRTQPEPPSNAYLNVHIESPILPLLLRDYHTSDAPAIHAILCNPLNTALDRSTAGQCPPVEEIEARISKQREDAAGESPSRAQFVIVDTQTSQVVGMSGFGLILTEDGGKRVGNVGVALNPEARGQGFGTDAIKLSIEYGFQKLGFDEVTVGTLEKNQPMVRIVEKELGWKGVRSQLETGEWEMFYRMGREEWFAGKVGKETV